MNLHPVPAAPAQHAGAAPEPRVPYLRVALFTIATAVPAVAAWFGLLAALVSYDHAKDLGDALLQFILVFFLGALVAFAVWTALLAEALRRWTRLAHPIIVGCCATASLPFSLTIKSFTNHVVAVSASRRLVATLPVFAPLIVALVVARLTGTRVRSIGTNSQR